MHPFNTYAHSRRVYLLLAATQRGAHHLGRAYDRRTRQAEGDEAEDRRAVDALPLRLGGVVHGLRLRERRYPTYALITLGAAADLHLKGVLLIVREGYAWERLVEVGAKRAAACC